ncbi:MAG TPA: biotin--[acetyl-CoA-carboxylase] ligase [Flavisolibacter sp.]|nr:biotin--[acetyl-CoA-carboxylase] ligase [Flavisolibacter sp.]
MSSLKLIGLPFIELHTVDSTNNYATGLVHAGMAQHGTAVFAHTQTKGRGQRNKPWISEAKNNVAISVVIEPDGLSTSQVFLLGKAVAVAVLHFFNNYARGGLSIKWPNDIYWCDRKAGGILIENSIQGGRWKYAIAGIGLNINQTNFSGLETRAVSLKQITGKTFEPRMLALELCDSIDQQYRRLFSEPQAISQAYHAALYRLNEKVRLKKGSQVFDAVIKEVTDLGQLVVEHGAEERFDVGEVEWVI